ncbi:MAG TPA: MbtH family NRPS accessory protein [Steroidobacteraceae bacterium]|nr:MbtH family NRPS accessory protein [Steroidobacteraceae bacterium]
MYEIQEEEFCVLVNAEGQHSLWPAFRDPGVADHR